METKYNNSNNNYQKKKTQNYSLLRLLLPPLLIPPLTFLVSLPLFIYHLIITYIVLPLFHPQLESQLTPYDSIFAVDDHTHPHAANITLIYLKDAFPIDSLKARFNSLLKLQNFSKLKKIFLSRYGYFWWTESLNFNIDNHVKKVENSFHGNDSFMEFLSNTMVKEFLVGVPMWEGLLCDVEGKSVIVLRVHHTYADGYSQNFIVDSLIGDCKRGKYYVKEKIGGGDNWWGWFWERALLVLKSPWLLSHLYTEALTTPATFYTQKKKSRTGTIAITTLDLEKFKQIRRSTETHFATIGMTLMCGALRRYFLETHQEADLPEKVGIMHSLPKANHPLTRLVNHWGVGLFKIGIEVKSPLERLLKGEEDWGEYCGEKKLDQLLHWHMPILGWVPGGVIRAFFNINFGTGMGFTSVPAVEEPVSMTDGDLKVPVEKLGKIFGFQWGQTAIATAIYTHFNTSATMTIYANKDIVPDQEGIDRVVGEYLHEEFDLLYKEVGVEMERRRSVGQGSSRQGQRGG